MRGKEITRLLYEVVDEINERLTRDRRLTKSPDTILFGKGGNLDSLGLVNLITLTEQKVEDKFGITITLADERALSPKETRFKTIGTLVDYVCLLLEEKANG